MASSSLSILVDEKKVGDLLRQKTGAKALLKSACNLLAFVGFIVLFTVMALYEPLPLYRSWEAYIRHRFDHSAAMRLEEVNTIKDFYQYMNNSLIPGIYSNNTRQYTFPGAVIPQMLKVDGDKANNRLFGVLRVRQVRVKAEGDCVLQEVFKPHFQKCYGKYTPETEDKADYGMSDSLGGIAKYTYKEDALSKPWAGWLAEYPAGGYMEKIHGNYSGAIDLVNTLKQDEWVGPMTRALWFEFTLYNFNLGLYAVNRISFEISPAGTWLKSLNVDIIGQRFLKPLGDGGFGAWMYLIMEAMLVMFVCRYLLEEMSEFIGFDNGHSKNPLRRVRIKYEYFVDGWNIIDWSNLILIFVVMGYRVTNWGIGADKIGNVKAILGVDVPVSEYRNFHDVVDNVQTIRKLTAFNCVLTWFKAVKYINVLPYISTFMETMSIAWKLLFGWVAVFITCFIGFCLSYATAFGDSITDFKTVPRAFVFLVRTFIGNADMRRVYDANPVIGSMLIVLFVVGMIFVNMNLFYAILISSLSEARQTQEVAQAKATAKLVDKFVGFFETAGRVLKLQARFRGCFPGLYSRMKQWEKARWALEKKRQDRMDLKAESNKREAEEEDALGSANPACGRRQSRKRASGEQLDEDSDQVSEVESEPDLGNLFFKEQLDPHKFHNAHHDDMLHDMHHEHHDEHMPNPFAAQQMDPEEMEREREEHAKEMVLEATEYVCQTIVDRCAGARKLVLAEMAEARDVFHGISSVLEVLGRRARSLEAQQEMVLPAEVVARVKEAQEEEEE